ncbi:hypothetical protein [Neisseria zoodegmatis]|uniref:Integral membrane protein n=1 Tax=Neisseria zoodegmatis TaxID=326523 RepID=A0AB38DNX2_9NEIS|nr:hypothetical protein [Neisseria zoodegmatis]OSI09606.1 hypothetical protein BWD10_08325 [Neisseria zoodegmatis]SNU78875.1 Uncharacterised protein [Neisseria zoodegmatis]
MINILLIILCLLIAALMGLSFLISIDKAFFDSIIVVITLIGLILNHLSSDDNSCIRKSMQKSATCFVMVIGSIIGILGVIWIIVSLISIFIYHKEVPYFHWVLGCLSVIIGSVVWLMKDKLKNSKGLSFAIYFLFILVIYIIFLFNDTATQSTLNNLKRLF